MASPQKISQLPSAGPLTGVELVPVVQNDGTLRTTVSAVAAFAVVSLLPVVSSLGTQIANVSSQIGVQTSLIDVLSSEVSSLSIRVDQVSALVSSNTVVVASAVAAVSTLAIQVDLVSAAVTSVNNVVSVLEIRVSAVSAVGTANSSSITSVNNIVSTLDTRLSEVSAAVVSVNAITSALDLRVAAVSASVSTLNIQIAAAQASISAINSTLATIDVSALAVLEPRVSALEIRLDVVSAATSANAAALVSTNNVVSTLELRVGAVSAATSVNAAAITSINAEVSLKAYRSGDFLTNVQYIDFNTTTSYAPAPGRLTWDIESGTLDLGLTGTVNLLVGQRTVAQIFNNSGTTLPVGKAVRVTGAQGQRLTGTLAQADSDADSVTIFGIMLETVSVNRSGYVATDGLVRNVNTSGFTDGDIVYLSPVSAGELTAIKPVAPQHLVQIGYIVKGGSVGAGSLYVKIQNGYELGELHDVKVSSSTSLASGETLVWDTSAGVWTNSLALINAQASVSALNIQVAAVSALTSVNAVAITSINNTVSALEIRVSAVSATAAANSAAITSINGVLTSILAILANTNFRITES